jgi:NAD(P)-dependent dehydrogenase (short-subunit alcohol dehydrogenase family)
VIARCGHLDILVNNAAVAWQGKTIDSPEIDNARMDWQWAINVTGVVANIRAAKLRFGRRLRAKIRCFPRRLSRPQADLRCISPLKL